MADGGEQSGTTEEKKSPKVKHDWYQTESHVVVTILAKNTKKEDVHIEFGDDSLRVTARLSDGSEYNLTSQLAHPILAGQSTYKVIPSKIEIKLKKNVGVWWTTLEKDSAAGDVTKPIPETVSTAGPPKYPSSAPKATDWDRVAGDIAKEEGDEKPEGEAALNALFQKIYSQGSDEVKRAMNKSFQESGGTVLSTNWNEVARDKVEVKAPDGMEWRKWDE